MPPLNRRNVLVFCAASLMLWTDIALAQWVFVARRAIGRIEQMSQTSTNGSTSYETATVIIDVPIDRVYETVNRRVRAAQGITVTKDDAGARKIEFTNGTQIAGIQAISLGDNLTQLIVSSAHSNAPASATSTIVQHIVAVCKELNVECSRGS